MPWNIPDDAERTYAQQAILYESDLDALVMGIGGDGVVSGCEVSAQGTPDATVAVASGAITLGGARVAISAGNVNVLSGTGGTAADATNPRLDLIVADGSGVLSAVAGTAAVAPIAPELPANRVLLARIQVPAGATTVASTAISSRVVNTPRIGVRANSAGSTVVRRRLNFIPGTNVSSITVDDDAANEEADITLNVSGSSGGNKMALLVAAANAPTAIKNAADYLCDGTADQVEINAAIAALPTNNGTISSYTNVFQGAGQVHCVGQFFLTAPIVANLDHFTLSGAGMGNTVFTVSSGFVGNYVISVNRDAQLRPCYFTNLRDFRVHGNGKLLNASSGTIYGVDAMVVQSRLQNVSAYDMSGDGIRVRGNLSPRWAGNSVVIDSCYGYKNGGVGFRCLDYGEDNRMMNSEFRENDSHGVWFNTSSWLVSDLFCWGNAGNGVLISGGSARLAFTNLKLEQNNGGLYIGASVGENPAPSEILIANGQFGSNGWTAANTYDDVQVNAVDKLHFTGCMWNDPYSQTARYGINFLAGTRMRVTGGAIYPTASYGTGQINIAGGITGTNLQIRDLERYTPIGLSSVTLTGSPMTITAGYTPETIYLRAGTVTSVTKSGNQIGASSNTSYELGPGEAIVVTYTGTPIIWRDRR